MICILSQSFIGLLLFQNVVNMIVCCNYTVMYVQFYEDNLTHDLSNSSVARSACQYWIYELSGARQPRVSGSEFIIMFCWCRAGDVLCGLRS